MCTALCTIVAHNIAQNRPDNFPSYPLDHCSDDVYLREGEKCTKCNINVSFYYYGYNLWGYVATGWSTPGLAGYTDQMDR